MVPLLRGIHSPLCRNRGGRALRDAVRGREMVQADKRDAEWRALITDVRSVYGGLVTYNCDKYQEERVGWWDAVDIISSSGYYPIDQWEERLDRIEGTVHRWNKPFFFMEAGCPSREGSAARPNDWSPRRPVGGGAAAVL